MQHHSFDAASTITTPSSAIFTDSSVDRSAPSSPFCLSGTTLARFTDPSQTSFSMPSPISQPASPPAAYADANLKTRGNGIMRRLSRGAQNKLRGRTSMTNLRNRDQRSGSIVRRRSQSRSMVDGGCDMSELELEPPEDSQSRASPRDSSPVPYAAAQASSRSGSMSRRSSDRGIAPARPPQPELSDVFRKITTKKDKKLRFWIDHGGARINWYQSSADASKTVYIDDIRALRLGDEALKHIEELKQNVEDLPYWLTIIYTDTSRTKGRLLKSLHLLAYETAVRDRWARAIRQRMKRREDTMAGLAGYDEKHWRNRWDEETVRKSQQNEPCEDNAMDFATLLKICRQYSIQKSEASLRQLFDQLDTQNLQYLDLSQFLEFFHRLTERRDIRDIYDGCKRPLDDGLNQDQFFTFLLEQQQYDVAHNRQHWLGVFEKFSTKKGPTKSQEDNHAVPVMSFEAFRDFLCSSDNSTLVTAPVFPQLDKPLGEYFISSSHNTYLVGRQVAGQSSCEMYAEVLKNGCRCVEVDCWDGAGGLPRVTHGNTMTTEVPFLDCIKVINTHAFVGSPYPLIISLEVHCNADQQRMMVKIMREVFGDKLVAKPITANARLLPSPEELRGRILIKVKRPREVPIVTTLAAPPMHRRQRSVSAPVPGRLAGLPNIGQRLHPINASSLSAEGLRLEHEEMPAIHTTTIASEENTSESDLDDDFDEFPIESKKKKTKQSNIIQELGALGVYTQGIPFSDWKGTDSRSMNHVYSFKESTFDDKCKTSESKQLLEKHNIRHLMRVYPKGTRWDSSNFNPLAFWRRGVQMCATNWQTYDVGTEINNAMFAKAADRTGYVMKPTELRYWREDEDGRRKIPRTRVNFSVKVISGQYIAGRANAPIDADVNPFITLEVFTADDQEEGSASGHGGADPSTKSSRHGIGSPLRKIGPIVKGNGYDPSFNEVFNVELFTQYPSLVFVRFAVYNSKDGVSNINGDLLSSCTVKLSNLEEGYKHLQLNNTSGEALHSSIFCYVNKMHSKDTVMQESLPVSTVTSPRSSEDVRPSREVLQRIFRRPSERKLSKRYDSGYISRTTSMEKQSR